MTINLPPAVRQALYILVTVGTPVVVYLFAKGTIGQLEVNLWTGIVSAVGLLAAFNTVKD